ncbi:MAG: hypothetical protein WC227_01740 [Patescibacteria group bacterium]|jgi:hypothetical protein
MTVKTRRNAERSDKNVHQKNVHQYLLSSDILEKDIERVLEELRPRIEDYKKAHAQKTEVPIRRFISLARIGHICQTTIWTVREAYERLSEGDRAIYSRGLAIAAIVREREKQTDRRNYRSYPSKLRWAVMRFVRRRIRAMRPIISIDDLARQYDMHPDAVSQLLRNCLSHEEHETWNKLVHLEKRTTVKQVKKRDPEGLGTHNGSGKLDNKNLAVARGWQRYPECQLHRLRDFVIENFHAASAGETTIVGYRQLRKTFGVAVSVIGDYLLSALSLEMFLERKRLSQSHPRKGKEPTGSSE